VQGPSELFKLLVARDIVESLRGAADQRLRWSQICDQMDTITDGFPFQFYKFENDVRLYRGRKLKADEFYPNSSDTGARDAADVKDYGRCHKPEMSVLYLSSNKETVMAELRADVGEKIQIAEYLIQPDADIKYGIVGEFDFVRRHNHGIFGNMEGGEAIKKLVRSFSELQRLRLHLTDAFMAECFRRPASSQRDYKITAAISEQYYEMGFDAFFYPSVQHLGGANFAVTGEKIQSFKVAHVEVVEITDAIGYGIYENAKLGESETPITSPIKWNRYEGMAAYYEDFLEFLKMAISFGPRIMLVCQYVALDPSGTANVTLEWSGIVDKAMTLDLFIKHGEEEGAKFDVLTFAYGSFDGDDRQGGITQAHIKYTEDSLKIATFDKYGKSIALQFQKTDASN
jgi:RES domain-containing protein